MAESTTTVPLGATESLLPLAMPLLQLLVRLRALPQADPAALRDRVAAGLQSFEARALAAGHAPDLVRRAHYALCDSLDGAVLSTPWGAAGAWQHGGMVASFHPAVGPGRFADLLRQAEAKPDAMRTVLEVMALCMSLAPGQGGGEESRQAALAALAGQASAPGALSAAWRGVEAPFHGARPRLPLWVAAAATLAAMGGAFLLFDTRVNDAGDGVFARLLAAPPAQMPRMEREAVPAPPPAPAPAEPTPADRVRARLAAPEAAGSVAVAGTPGVPVLRLAEGALFPPGAATLLPAAAPVLAAVAEALRPEGGRLRVLGFTDDRSVRGVAFPSAFKLTAARAETVRAALARLLGPGATLAAEGRAGAEPVAPNTTPEGRASNRWIEIVLEGAPP